MIKFEQKIDIKSGSLISRLMQVDKGERYSIYDQKRLEIDDDIIESRKENYRKVTLNPKNDAVKVMGGEVVFNMMTGECVKIGNINKPMILPYNYVILEPKSSEVLRDYIVFWFNYSERAMSQIEESLQGSKKVKKISLKSLKSFDIEIPNIEKQEIISKILEKRKKAKRLQQRKEILERKKLSLVFKV